MAGFGVAITMAIGSQGFEGPVWGFLMRGWQTPYLHEYAYFVAGGFIVLTLAFVSTNVYSNVEATLVAPFEYVALPTAVIWGILIWDDWPDLNAWVGIALIVGSGLFVIYRENAKDQEVVASVPMRASTTNNENISEDQLIGHRHYEPMPLCF